MPAWITVYLQTPELALNSESVRGGIADADWWTLGESVGLDEEDVDAFMKQVRWSDLPLEVHVEPERRPIQLHDWAEPDRVRVELEELDERLATAMPARVRDNLARVQRVIGIELGWSQLGTMYEVLAFEIAYWLAEAGSGLILSHDDQWYDHDQHRWEPIGPPDGT